MCNRSIGLALTIVFGVIFVSGPAIAGLKVCNKSSDNAQVATASASRIGFTNGGGYFSVVIWGWFDVPAGACQMLDTNPNPPIYPRGPTSIWYIHARSADGRTWTTPLRSTHAVTDLNGYVWNVNENFCEPRPAPDGRASVTSDRMDPSSTCQRLPYLIVSDISGSDYAIDLAP